MCSMLLPSPTSTLLPLAVQMLPTPFSFNLHNHGELDIYIYIYSLSLWHTFDVWSLLLFQCHPNLHIVAASCSDVHLHSTLWFQPHHYYYLILSAASCWSAFTSACSHASVHFYPFFSPTTYSSVCTTTMSHSTRPMSTLSRVTMTVLDNSMMLCTGSRSTLTQICRTVASQGRKTMADSRYVKCSSWWFLTMYY